MAIKFYINDQDRAQIIHDANTAMKKQIEQFRKNPHWFGGKSITELAPSWKENAITLATFEQLKRDGIARIEKIADEFYNFDDLCGDAFNPEVNDDIDPAQLRKEKAAFKQRVKRSGVWIMELLVNGESCGSICGFVGNDFYGSGYDTDFYNTAIEKCADVQAHYAEQIASVAREASRIKKEY